MAQVTPNAQPALTIETVSTDTLVPDPRNARRHPAKQIAKLASSIRAHGFCNPIIIDENNQLIAGHGRLEAVKVLGLTSVPCIRLTHLSAAQKTALALADNKLGDLSDFDGKKLKALLLDLTGADFNVELTGFDTAEVDFCIDGAGDEAGEAADAVDAPDDSRPAVSRTGDLWVLGDHHLHCGDALDAASYDRLLGESRAAMTFTDPPYNVPIKGHVSGLGRKTHREFAMASGEMSEAKFSSFLTASMTLMAAYSLDGAIHFLCMDWRHGAALQGAAEGIFSELKNICVWNKTNAGMGSFYRSQHEFIYVFKKGTAPHQNNIQLGKYGRHRSNVWTYPGATAFGGTRGGDLALHPTVKPVALVADAIRDCSKRGAIILDPFAGSGTTILAAERTGRRAAAIEIDPLYVDTAIRRWQTLTGKAAVLVGDGRSFGEIEAARLGAATAPAALTGEEV
jgi:DNA modification methylase